MAEAEADEFEGFRPSDPEPHTLSFSRRCPHCQARRARRKTCWYCGIKLALPGRHKARREE